MRKICIVVGSRANYSSIKSVMRAVQNHPDLQLQVVAGASALLDRFGAVVDVIEADGFPPDARVHMLIEGENPVT
ncbi:MAG TPA: UDP-N-acetylglucosamine 2-epimerase (hydrolyzing), partial [Chloroflexi bacterium]|nr:UDP-N-acetylglucosamine 2-epimerase (hydrolyzing) [Chloroflexota bacterium]